jgi:hypothetical protein
MEQETLRITWYNWLKRKGYALFFLTPWIDEV